MRSPKLPCLGPTAGTLSDEKRHKLRCAHACARWAILLRDWLPPPRRGDRGPQEALPSRPEVQKIASLSIPSPRASLFFRFCWAREGALSPNSGFVRGNKARKNPFLRLGEGLETVGKYLKGVLGGLYPPTAPPGLCVSLHGQLSGSRAKPGA